MKRILTVLMILCILLVGCAKKSEEPEPAPAPSPTPQQPDETEKITTETYYCISGSYADPYRPKLMVMSDGTFVYVENLYEGMGEYRGTYTIEGGEIICNVEYVGFGGYAGDDVTEIRFRAEGDVLVLDRDLCSSFKGYLFSDDLSKIPEQTLSAYYSQAGRFDKNNEPNVIFFEDGSFLFYEATKEGFGAYTGTYEREDNILHLTVQSVDFTGKGADVTEITMEIVSDEELELQTDLCRSLAKDLFKYGEVKK